MIDEIAIHDVKYISVRAVAGVTGASWTCVTFHCKDNVHIEVNAWGIPPEGKINAPPPLATIQTIETEPGQ